MAGDNWYVRINTKIWDDPWFDALQSDKHKLVWLYLISPVEHSKTGIIELNIRRLCQRLRIRASRLKSILNDLRNDGKIILETEQKWDANCVVTQYLLVTNFVSFQSYAGSAQIGVLSELDNLVTAAPNLVQHWRNRYPGYAEGVPQVYRGCSHKQKQKQKEEYKQKQKEEEGDGQAVAGGFDIEPIEEEILGSLKIISDRGQGDYDADATLKYLRTNLSKDYPYQVILQAVRLMDGWLLKDRNRNQQWGHNRLRKFCSGIEVERELTDEERREW